MEITLGKKIAQLRKAAGMTQEELAEKMNVSPQAVSKWENDSTCPDIMTLPKIAKLFNVTVDELLSQEVVAETRIVPLEERKNIDDMMLKVTVNSVKGDKVRVNLPVPLIRVGLEMGVAIPEVGGNSQFLQNIDFAKILAMLDKGLIGKLVEVETADGDIVEVVVE
jgi:transcriptional regulator with XRE-family HTH domain